MTDARVRFTVPRRRRPVPTRRALTATVAALLGLALTPAAAASAASPTTSGVRPTATGHTYVVTSTGTGMQSLAEVVAHVVQPGDVVELADGVYRTSDITLRVPNVTIRAQHLPAAGASAPRVWLDGS